MRTNIIEHLLLYYAQKNLVLRDEYMSCLDTPWDSIEYWLDCPVPFIRFLLPLCFREAREKGTKLGISVRAVILPGALARSESMSVTMIRKKLRWSKRAILKSTEELFGVGYVDTSMIYGVTRYGVGIYGALSILLGKYVDYQYLDLYLSDNHEPSVYCETINHVLNQHGFLKLKTPIPGERTNGLFHV